MRIPTLVVSGVVTLVGLTAAVISYGHIRSLALTAGESPLAAALLPLSVDCAVVGGMAVRWSDARSGRSTSPWVWTLLGLGIAASLVANVASAHPTVAARLIAGWPAVVLALCIETLSVTLRTRPDTSDEEPPLRLVHADRTGDDEAVRTIRSLDADHDGPVSRRTIMAALGCGAPRATRLAEIARTAA